MANQVNTTVERVVLETIDQGAAALKGAAANWKQLRSSIDTVKNALGAVGVTVGVGAMLTLARDVLASNAALDDMSESTGASVEMLSALSRQAKVSGFDMGFVTDSMGRMVKGLKGADEEGQAAAHALKFLGIEAKDANGNFRDQGDVMVEVAKKLKGLADDGNKLALVQDLYGKGAQRLLPYLKDLADGTDAHAKVTREQAAQAEEAEKMLRRLNLVMEDGRRELVVEYTPALIKFTEKLLEASRASGGLAAGIATMLTAGTDDIPKRLQEIEAEIERKTKAAENRPWYTPSFLDAGGTALKVQVGRLMQEREYLIGLQQRRLGGLMQGMVEDPAGIHPEPAKPRSGYVSPERGDKDKKGLSGYERAVLEAEQAIAKARTGNSEFVSTQLDIAAGKYGQLNEKQKEHLLQLAGQRDLERDLAEQRKEHDKAREEIGKIEAEAQERRRVDYERLMEEFEGEEEQEWRRYERKLEILRQTVSDQEEFNNLAETLDAQHQAKLTAIHDAELRRRTGAAQIHRQMDLAGAKTFFGYMSLLMQTKSKEMFEIGKAAAIAETVINTYSMAVKAYDSLAKIPFVGPALGAAAAAAAIAYGFAQVSAIKSQSYGSGGGGAVGTFPASPVTGLPTSPVPEAVGAPAAQQRQATTKIDIHVQDALSQGVMEQLATRLNELKKDGFPLFEASVVT